MDRVAVVTDSSACVPKEVIEQYGIHILPLILIFEHRSYRDGVDITSQEFYELLKKAKKIPTTSSPSPGEYFEVFREVAKQASGILCITLPPHLSMSFDSATQAREMVRAALPQVDINVFPSRSPALAQAWLPSVDNLRLYAFLEGARLKVLEPLPAEASIHILSSAGIGLRLRAANRLALTVNAGWPFKETGSASNPTTRARKARVQFNTTMDF